MSLEPARPDAPSIAQERRWRIARGILVLVMGAVSIGAPFWLGEATVSLVGILLTVVGVLEAAQTFQTEDDRARRSSYLSGALLVAAGQLLWAAPVLALTALVYLVAGSFLLDGAGKVVGALRAHKRANGGWRGLASGIGNVALGGLLALQWPVPGLYGIGIFAGLRMLGAAWTMLFGPPPASTEPPPPPLGDHPDRYLRLPPHPELTKLKETLEAEEAARRPIDAYWCLMFILTFLAIHVGRTEAEWTLVGFLSPAVAVAGDVMVALLLAFFVILPILLGWRRLWRPLELRAWNHRLALADHGKKRGFWGRWVDRWLAQRCRFSLRMRANRYSPRSAARWGLQIGLPLVAILIATNPIWGFSWYFNSENWASEIWNRWAAARVDKWRAAMTNAVVADYAAGPVGSTDLFAVQPDGVAGTEDFSFLVLGDPGEGDASQHALRDRYLFLGQRPDIRFMVISSDVIYPAGAMKDYETNFYLPLKGFSKPIYAIPGNHDWFDALEGFAANLLEPDAARAAMDARMAVDRDIGTTTDRRIATLIDQAKRLRQAYGVRSGQQRAPFFEIQSDRFALIAVDTGIVRAIDPAEKEWFRAALERAKGKFRFVLLGHPLYAAGHYQAEGDKDFVPIHEILRAYQVDLVMAGDTHDFEYYAESYETDGQARTMQHFVNGGGGAYLSIGTPLSFPSTPAVANCAYYPRTDAIQAKLEVEVRWWKRPFWMWIKHLGAWPSSVEAMASAFSYDQAPFFQSFVEVQVVGSENEVRLLVHGTMGQLSWRDLDIRGRVRPTGSSEDDPVQFVFPLPPKPPTVPPDLPPRPPRGPGN